MAIHKHRAHGAHVMRPFAGPVSARENRAAHGGVCYVDRCRCGAERRTNRNGSAIERPWVADG